MATPRVGGEVDALCTKCRMSLAHTILAMVGSKIARVRCNTCGGDHTYRSETSTSSRSGTSASKSRPTKAEKLVISFEQRIAEKDRSKARRYSPKDTYVLEDLLDHPTFGLGIVQEVRGDKVEVAFKADLKTLIHGRGEPTARPTFQPPRAGSLSPADKPHPVDGESEAG